MTTSAKGYAALIQEWNMNKQSAPNHTPLSTTQVYNLATWLHQHAKKDA